MCDVCDVTSKISEFIYAWYNSYDRVREETLTQYMLHQLSLQCQQIRHVEFNHYQEKRNGADWDWYVLFPDGVVHLRIQAKKLLVKGNQAGMTYPKGTAGQIKSLIKSSADVGAMAIYVFYWKDQGPTLCTLRVPVRDGVFVCSANVVMNELVGKIANVTANDALKVSLPLPCMFCCPGNSERSGRLWLDRIKDKYGEDSEGKRSDGGFSERLPPLLVELLERDMRVDLQWYQKYSSLLKDTKAIMVLDNRKGSRK